MGQAHAGSGRHWKGAPNFNVALSITASTCLPQFCRSMHRSYFSTVRPRPTVPSPAWPHLHACPVNTATTATICPACCCCCCCCPLQLEALMACSLPSSHRQREGSGTPWNTAACVSLRRQACRGARVCCISGHCPTAALLPSHSCKVGRCLSGASCASRPHSCKVDRCLSGASCASRPHSCKVDRCLSGAPCASRPQGLLRDCSALCCCCCCSAAQGLQCSLLPRDCSALCCHPCCCCCCCRRRCSCSHRCCRRWQSCKGRILLRKRCPPR